MLAAYNYEGKKIIQCDNCDVQKSLKDAIWIDLHSPTLEEERQVEAVLGIDIPTKDEMAALELSNRLYKENDTYYFTITMLTHVDSSEPENKIYTFVVTNKQLITVRYANTQPFNVIFDRLQKQELLTESNPKLIAVYLFEAVTNRLADILEHHGKKIDALSKNVFGFKKAISSKKKDVQQNLDLEEVICSIGIEGDMLSNLKESLVSMSRLMNFIKQSNFLEKDSEEDHRMEIVNVDIISLSDHATFLSNKVTFLLDATLGLIAIQQNGIIKIFSVASVIFLPPTLVASIYGMNFVHMPELQWKYGYPMVIFLIVLAAYLPYRFFKFKKWL